MVIAAEKGALVPSLHAPKQEFRRDIQHWIRSQLPTRGEYELLAALSGASVTTSKTDILPAGSIVWGVLIRVDTAVTGATTFDVGDGTDVDRWGAGIAIAAGTTTTIADFTTTGPEWVTADTAVTLTANGANFTGGDVYIRSYYTELPPIEVG